MVFYAYLASGAALCLREFHWSAISDCGAQSTGCSFRALLTRRF